MPKVEIITTAVAATVLMAALTTQARAQLGMPNYFGCCATQRAPLVPNYLPQTQVPIQRAYPPIGSPVFPTAPQPQPRIWVQRASRRALVARRRSPGRVLC